MITWVPTLVITLAILAAIYISSLIIVHTSIANVTSAQEITTLTDESMNKLIALNYLKTPIIIDGVSMTVGDYIASTPFFEEHKLEDITPELFEGQDICFKLTRLSTTLVVHCSDPVKQRTLLGPVYRGTSLLSFEQPPDTIIDLPLFDHQTASLEFRFA